MPSEKDDILKSNKYMKSVEMPDIINANLQSLIKKIDEFANNVEKSSTSKLGGHIICKYLRSAIWALNNIENKHSLCCGEDFMKEFCNSITEDATNVINFEKKKMLSLTKES